MYSKRNFSNYNSLYSNSTAAGLLLVWYILHVYILPHCETRFGFLFLDQLRHVFWFFFLQVLDNFSYNPLLLKYRYKL